MVWPALLVLAPLLLLPDFWLAGNLSDQQVDILPFWLPRWCFLGRSVAAGFVPTWLPHQFAGVPFASDPQSGWLYAPATLLFAALPCDRAMGLAIVLNPILAGLGLYMFLRLEGLGRPAAAVGGLTLSLPMAGSVVALSMPFAGTLAWTSVALAAAAGYVRSEGLTRTLLWLALVEFALWQAAGAHLTNGLLLAFLVVGMYLAVRSIQRVRSERLTARAAILRGGAVFLAFPILAAAVLFPRIALLPRTSIGLGYGHLAELAEQLTGRAAAPAFGRRGLSLWWGTAFARGPGGYVGVLAVLLAPRALSDRRWRWPAAGFATLGVLGWLLESEWLVSIGWIRSVALSNPLGELWLRDPHRFGYLLLFAFAVLAGYGVQAWVDGSARSDPLAAGRWLIAALVLFAVIPLAAGSPAGAYVPLGVSLVAAIPVLFLSATGRRWAIAALPALTAIELLAVGVIGRAMVSPLDQERPQREVPGRFSHAYARLAWAGIDGGRYVRAGPIGAALLAGMDERRRYFAFRPGLAREQLRFGRPPRTAVIPASYFDGRSILLGLDEIQGYSPVQLQPYWELVREATGIPLHHNAATFDRMDPSILKLFAVGWVVAPQTMEPEPGWSAVAMEDGFVLYRLPMASTRAELSFDWRIVSARAAREQILSPAAESPSPILLESEPILAGRALMPGRPGRQSVVYREPHPGWVEISVDATAPGVLLVRNAFDSGWEARLDGREVQVLVADYMMQAVAVPAGPHRVVLQYRDPALAAGVAVSAAGWLALFALTAGSQVRGNLRLRRTGTRAGG
jgi:hypothetical protein